MNIFYNDKTDLLYFRFDAPKKEATNKRVMEDVVLDLGEGDKILGIEILNASNHVNLKNILPIQWTRSNQDRI